MKVIAFLIGLLFVLSGIAIFSGAKSAIHEGLGAMFLIAACVCIACAFIMDLLDANERKAKQRADEQRELLVSLLNELSKQTVLQGKLADSAREQIGDAFSTREGNLQSNSEVLAHLQKLAAIGQHTNKLLEWVGDQNAARINAGQS